MGRLRPYEPFLMTVHRLVDAGIGAGLFLLLSHACGMYQEPLYPTAAVGIFLLSGGLFHLMGIYRSWRGTPLREECSHLFTACLIMYVTLLGLGFILKVTQIYSRRVLMTWMILLPIVLCVERTALRTFLRAARAKGRNARHVVVAGRGPLAESLIGWLKLNPWIGANVLGFFDDKTEGPVHSVPHLGTLAQLPAYVKQNHIDQVYLALPSRAQDKIEWLLRELADSTASVFVVPDLFLSSLFLGGHMIRLDNMTLIALRESPHRGINQVIKRVEDIILASAGLILSAPLMLAIVILVKATSKGPVLFKQWRYGLDGRPIKVYKFRTMTVCEDGYDFCQAKKCDPRVTPVGRFLRRTSLDEFPQLINVLQGRMSVVGPRPHPVALNEEFRKKVFGYMLRHKIRPGITGLAQVNGWRGETDTVLKMQKRVEYDLEYLRSWSLWLDLKILVMTVWMVVKGKNAY